MEKYEVIIIGAGASGLMCALSTNQPTLLIEASDRVGKKILATGNGKCNISNNVIDAGCYNTPLVAGYFKKFDQVQTLKYFEQLGIFTYADEAGRRYPLSNSANTVLDILLKALSLKQNVTTVVNTMPMTIKQSQNGFTIITTGKSYTCRNLVIATGGNSGTKYLEQLGVKYEKFMPSLMGLKTTKNKGLVGVRVSNVRVCFNDFYEVGEVLFKDDGISGIVIFNLSAYLARRKIKSGQIKLDLLAQIDFGDLLKMLTASVKHNPSYLLVDILEGLLHKSLAKNLLEKLAMLHKLAKEITASEIELVAQTIKNYVVDFVGYADNNQVHTGGVDLRSLDENLQHKQVRGLYCIGEVVNVDGICGGYNLQWAWTSGKIVGDNL